MEKKHRIIFKFLDNLENYICQFLLAFFVVLLFIQILLREFFEYSLSWGEELATYMFVWFVFFGACYACRLGAHNRVTFQFKIFPKKVAMWIEAFSDLIWVGFNCYFIYLSYQFVFVKMNLFWKSQTMGIPMKYVYMVLPISFVFMTVRVLQINYLKLVKGIDIRDPDAIEVEKTLESGANEIKDI
ncbi:TRAP-type C4-dicarboxylate transport system, small permease component [Desulfocicer vacuolatum DSM 3385]|uniref:TRAP-type C4-dicarboxylate transport system, small permease component n=1 Tax=Desulfocicer vacuolatum DSM 3385 TaxID=1121400 RepID=A0A1W2AHS2_9BACT|nr:TRAP transporter small permease [Desulfocicer vacuolatum]SMC60246.1 TRAP-type C4-dicarboxylate transport system, small permease component [Desulfocicer vacuolatum DSM 3385]